MPEAILLTQYGSPDVLEWRDGPILEPGPGQIRIRVRAAGVGPTGQRHCPMKQAAEAHRLLENNEAHEKLILDTP